MPTIYESISYEHTTSGQVYILVKHQTIHCPRLANHLMCPMQIQMSGVSINDFPKVLAEDQYEKTHSVKVNDQLNPNESLIIPLVLKGVTVYFLSRESKSK